MVELEKVTYGLRCMFYGDVECKECPYARNGSGWHDCRSNCAKDALALLQEQKDTINELQNAYSYLQKQFFEAQDKLLKEQETELCDRCGRRRLKSNREVK